MIKEETLIQVISIVCSSVIAVVAVIVSIISIKRQTKSQMIDANIQLFDKRFEIYLFTIDLWYIIGYLEAGLDILRKKRTYKNILKSVNKLKFSEEVLKKIEKAYQNSHKYEIMQKCLFSGSVSDYLNQLLSNFTIYINGIYHKNSVFEEYEETAYQNLLELYRTQEIDTEELRKFI